MQNRRPVTTPDLASVCMGEQSDGSVIDAFGEKMTRDARLKIIESVASLPVQEYRDKVLSIIGSGAPVTIIQAPTGSGKTTQIPKWTAEASGFQQRVVVTQPRVLAARSNAARVSQELLAETGDPAYSLGQSKVGYRTGQGSSSIHASQLSFHTDGLELMRQIYGQSPDILFMDEVHNFAIPTEFLGMLVRKRMKTSRDKIQLIIMSATLDPDIFQEYFRDIDSDIPVVRIPGRTYPVKDRMRTGDLVEDVRECLKKKENIIIFVPGKKEILSITSILRKHIEDEVEIHGLHAEMTKGEQEVLLKNTTSKPRIIIATNVAEESITIDYATTVIDLGKHKVISYDDHGFPILELQDISDANRKQRRGRVGRTHPGNAIWASDTPIEELDPYPDAPIEKEMLDRYILICLSDGIDIWKERDTLEAEGKNMFFHDFDERLFQISMKKLDQIGAISRGKITDYGRNLLRFPVDIEHAAMLLEAIEQDCIDPIIHAISILGEKGFLSKEGKWKELKIEKTHEGDIFYYMEVLRLLLTTKITNAQAENLIRLGVDKDQIRAFQGGANGQKLYQVVDLTAVGVKRKHIEQIDKSIENLRQIFADMNIPLSSSKNIHALKTSLAAGSRNTLFQFQAENGRFILFGEARESGKMLLKAGDISTVNPKTGVLYIGSPFIIGGVDGTEDLPLLTFITPIERAHIDAIVSQPTRSTEKEGKKRALPTLTIDGAIQAYARGIERYHPEDSNVFETTETAVDYYFRYLLPDFMIGHNPQVKKYINSHRDIDLGIFRSLLLRILEGEKSRIRINNIAFTENSFRHDTIVMEEFMNSQDPFIVAFREGRPLPLVQQDRKHGTIENGERSDIVNTEASEKKKREYAYLLGEMKRKRSPVDRQAELSDTIEIYLNTIADLSITFSGFGKLLEQLKNAQDVHKKDLSPIQRLKNAGRSERRIKKLQQERMRLVVECVEQKNNPEVYQYLLGEKEKIQIQINEELRSRNLEDFPILQQIQEHIAKIFVDFFGSQAFTNLIKTHLLEITRQVVREVIMEGRDLKEVMREVIMRYDLRQSDVDIVRRFGERLYDYDFDFADGKDRYEVVLLPEVMKSGDEEYLTKVVAELRDYIVKMGVSRQELTETKDQIRFDPYNLDSLLVRYSEFQIEEVHPTVKKKRRSEQVVQRSGPTGISRRILKKEQKNKEKQDTENEMRKFIYYYKDAIITVETRIAKILGAIREKQSGKNHPARSKYNKYTISELQKMLDNTKEEKIKLEQEKDRPIIFEDTPENRKLYMSLKESLKK